MYSLAFNYSNLPRIGSSYRYIINHSKNLYVDKQNQPLLKSINYEIHPLPLLTCEGNGRGGGDYHGSNQHLVGTWSRDIISVDNELPTGDFEELVCDFQE